MALINPNTKYTSPTNSLMVLSASAAAGSNIDTEINFANNTQIVAVFGMKPGDPGTTLEVLINPDPDVWDGGPVTLGGVKITDAQTTVHFQEPVPIVPPGSLFLKTTGAFTGSQYISVVVRANTSQSGL